MKVSKRQVPNDVLSFDWKGYRVYVATERNEVAVRVQKHGETVHVQTFTPDQFISLLMRDAR